jgi:hypothetical protein
MHYATTTNILLSMVITTVIMVAGIDGAYATHTSIPVIEPLPFYLVNENHQLNGTILYNGQPTSNVLVEVTISAPDGSTIKEYVRSSDDGSFSVIFKPRSSGYHTLIVTSYCRDVHRNICTYQSTTMQLLVLEEITKDICIMDECVARLSAKVAGLRIEDAELKPDDKVLRLRLYVEDDGYMLLELPRSIIDAEQGLIVQVDHSRVDYKEYADENLRIIEARFHDTPAGTIIYMDIIGTYAIPEFSSSYIVLISMLMVPLLAIIYRMKSHSNSCLKSLS